MADKSTTAVGENEQEQYIIEKSGKPINHILGYVVNTAMVVWFLLYPLDFSTTLAIPHLTFWSLFGGGLFLWTFAEYWLHRGPYHHKPEIFRVGHMLHHKYPKALLGVPFYVTTALMVAVFFLLSLAIGFKYAGSLLAGFWVGYIAYTLLHHSTHFLKIKLPYLAFIRRHHLQHHVHADKNFGFVTNFWDIVFRTNYKSKKRSLI